MYFTCDFRRNLWDSAALLFLGFASPIRNAAWVVTAAILALFAACFHLPGACHGRS